MTIFIVENAKEALFLLKQTENVSVVITDVSLPGSNGLDLASEIVNIYCSKRSIEVILMSWYIAHGLRREATRLGIYACLNKSSPIELIVETIKDAMTSRLLKNPLTTLDPL